MKKLSNKEISVKKAYASLYEAEKSPKKHRASFVKLRITIPEEKGVNRFLAFLFFCPIPIFIFRWALRLAKTDLQAESGLSKKDIIELVSTKDIFIDVKTESGEKIRIRTF
ncbi:MAG TPA: hypothetical protein PLH02_02520 [Bacillota bacterium]|nr:hypothetical protein [Bacillota bacterium]HRX91271.1 hypothetical protein [Candidatus Izemoplasmatales bacterium]